MWLIKREYSIGKVKYRLFLRRNRALRSARPAELTISEVGDGPVTTDRLKCGEKGIIWSLVGRRPEPWNMGAEVEVVVRPPVRVNHISTGLARSQDRVACLIET